jgi:TP901-1 family phage major tail protein
VRRAQVTGAGLFKDAASDALVRQRFFAGALVDAELILPDFGVIAGPFQISALDYRGDHAGEVTFEITLDSAGAIAFTPV